MNLGRYGSWFVVGLLALAAVGLAYSFLPQKSVIAEVRATAGEVSRSERGAEEAWLPAQVGDGLSFGDALRTGPAARARVVLGDGSTLELEPGTIVRFLESAQKRARLRVDTGLATLEASGDELVVTGSARLVRVSARSRVRLSEDGRGTRIAVSFGRASFVDGAEGEALPGDELVVPKAGPAAVQRAQVAAQPGDSLVAAAPTAVEPVPAAVEDPARPAPRPLEPAQRADLTVPVGERATVHVPSAGPVRVRLRLGDRCDGAPARVEAGRKGRKLRPLEPAAGAPVITAQPGVTRYRVQCARGDGRTVVSGSVRVVRDVAARRVPLKPPENGVDLDGRKYTVLYQNRLPSVVARYAAIPAGRPTRLRVEGGGEARTFDGAGPSLKLPAGALEDGEHAVTLESADGAIRSPRTTLRIAFDNAAPTASFDQRGTLAREPDGRAHLSGIVPQGARVSLEGQALSVDGSGRFSADATVDGNDGTIVVRVDHPRAGLHYYVRRVAGGAP